MNNKILLTNALVSIFFLSCEFSKKEVKTEPSNVMSDSQYEDLKLKVSKITGQSKEIFLGYVLGSTNYEAEIHTRDLLNEKKIKKTPYSERLIDFDGRKLKIGSGLKGDKYSYQFFLSEHEYFSGISYGLTSDRLFIKEFSIEIYNHILAEKTLIPISDLVELLGKKYGKPIRIKDGAFSDEYFWLLNGYEIKLYTTEEFKGSDFVFSSRYITHIDFTDLALELSDSEKEKIKIQEKIKEGQKKIENDL